VILAALPPERETVIAKKKRGICLEITRTICNYGPEILVAFYAMSRLLARALNETAKIPVRNFKFRFVHKRVTQLRRTWCRSSQSNGNTVFALPRYGIWQYTKGRNRLMASSKPETEKPLGFIVANARLGCEYCSYWSQATRVRFSFLLKLAEKLEETQQGLLMSSRPRRNRCCERANLDAASLMEGHHGKSKDGLPNQGQTVSELVPHPLPSAVRARLGEGGLRP
jgi:hypothetical protein